MSSSQNLNDRLSFMKLDAAAVRNIQEIRPIICRELPGALDGFYEQVRAFPQTRRFFSGEGRIAGAKSKQLAHWEWISNGRFDESYVGAVTAVGEVHARIGLEPRWYIGGYSLVLETLIAKVTESRWPKGGFGVRRADAAKLGAELGALAKATLLDMDLAISVYLEAAEAARKKAEIEVLAKERASVVDSFGQAMSALSRGDLTYRMADNLPPEYARLRQDFNAAMGQLQETLAGISAATGTVQISADEIASASDNLSRRTEQQAASLEQTAAALDEITATVKRSAEGAGQAAGAASMAKADAERSGEVVREAVSAMGEIAESSRQINQIIGVIDEIAFQTNLLALNAGVEAARAGDAGRGFAVVAQEVRALAQRSAEAAKEIKALISSSTLQVERGVKLVGDTGVALVEIVGKAGEIDGLIREIAASSQEQATGLAQVNIAVNQMDQITQQNAAMVEQATAAASSLKAEAAELVRGVARFQIGDDDRAAVRGGGRARPAPARSPARPAQPPVRIYADGTPARGASAADPWEEF